MAYHVRIDHVAQGPDGGEKPADRLQIDHKDFLSIYVEAELPGGAPPKGRYGAETPDGRVNAWHPLRPPELCKRQYRFRVDHYTLGASARYRFHFADDPAVPMYEDSWEIVTLP